MWIRIPNNDPDPGSSWIRIQYGSNTDPIRIRIYNTDLPPPRTTLWGVRRQIVLRKTIVVVENLVTLSLQNTQLGSVFKIKIVFLSMYLVQVITVAYDDRLRPLLAFLYRELCAGDHGGVWWPAAPVWYQQADRCSLQQQGTTPVLSWHSFIEYYRYLFKS